MPERLMLVDSDIFIILAAAGVLETAASLLEFEPEDIRRLPALENQLTRGRAFRKNYPRHIRQAALRACSCICAFSNMAYITLSIAPEGEQ